MNKFEDFLLEYCDFSFFCGDVFWLIWLEFSQICTPFIICLACWCFLSLPQECMITFWVCDYNFTNQDFVVFPASTTTSLIFCKVIVHTAQPVKFLVHLLGGFTREQTLNKLLGWLCTWHYVGATWDENLTCQKLWQIPYPDEP